MNTRTARSQLMGGMVWGISSALHEATEIDKRYARYVNDNLADCRIPVNADVERVEVILVSEIDHDVNPAGIKDGWPRSLHFVPSWACEANENTLATPEVSDFIQVGGLGAVSAALPRALRGFADIRVIIPGYPAVMRGIEDLEIVGRCQPYAELPDFNIGTGHVGDRLTYYVVLCPAERLGTPYGDVRGVDWHDNDIRFATFSYAAAQLARGFHRQILVFQIWSMRTTGIAGSSRPTLSGPTHVFLLSSRSITLHTKESSTVVRLPPSASLRPASTLTGSSFTTGSQAFDWSDTATAYAALYKASI
jgi:hypothetical protein